MSCVSFHYKYAGFDRAIYVQIDRPLTEAQERYFSAKLSQCLGSCVRSLGDPDFEWWRWEVGGVPPEVDDAAKK